MDLEGGRSGLQALRLVDREERLVGSVAKSRRGRWRLGCTGSGQVEAGDWVRTDCEERAAAAAGLEGIGLPRV